MCSLISEKKNINTDERIGTSWSEYDWSVADLLPTVEVDCVVR